MDTVKYGSIYSKYSQKEIDEMDERFREMNREITAYAVNIIREIDELVFSFFKQHIIGIKPISYFTKEDLVEMGKPFKIIYEKFPIGGEMWESYKLEHNEKGLCAYFIYKIEPNKIVYKKINILE